MCMKLRKNGILLNSAFPIYVGKEESVVHTSPVESGAYQMTLNVLWMRG